MQDGDLPQLELYCHGKSLVSKSSIKALNKNAHYVPLTCKNDGTFTIFNSTDSTNVDVYNAKCTRKQYPQLTKHENEDILCSDLGADGRSNDLENYIHTVQIGWNMSAMKPNVGMKEMVSINKVNHNTSNK